MDLLNVPNKRLQKYYFVLQELLENTAESHEDFFNLKSALNKMKEIAEFCSTPKVCSSISFFSFPSLVVDLLARAEGEFRGPPKDSGKLGKGSPETAKEYPAVH